MKVSVVVPAYNEEKSLAIALESLKNQDYQDYELIVVDNNSTDKTNEIAKKFTDRVYVEKKKGYMYAVMRGANEACGDLITFCDADSLYPKKWLTQVVREFKKKPKAVALYGGANTYDASLIQNMINGFFYNNFLRFSRLLGLDNTSGFNFVMKREAFFKVGGYDPEFKKMSPDLELAQRLKKVGKIIFNPRIKVRSSFRRYKDGGVAATQVMFLKSWWAILRGKAPKLDYDEYNKEIR